VNVAPAPYRFSTLAHAGRALLGPLSPAPVDALLARIELQPPAGGRPAVVDVGCGKGEILVRAMVRFGATGTGVDPNPAFLAEARARAADVALEHDIDLRCATLTEACVPPRAFDLAICTGASHAFGDLEAALAGLAPLVRGSGWALLGHGYWQREPAAEYLAAFGGSAGELAPLEATLGAAGRSGWTLPAHHVSTQAEWDDYERTYAATLRTWLGEHPDDPDAPAFHERIETWSSAYERWGRGTMGFVTMLLRR
jgi:SAM-dependent methyltransferase